MVSMIEAAQRAALKQPIVRKEAPTHWEGTWHYQIHLCAQDLVRWDDDSVFDSEHMHPTFRQTPYFRVQSMSSMSETSLDISLRHHSVSGTDDKWGLIRIRSLSNMHCSLAHIGNLGYYDDQTHD